MTTTVKQNYYKIAFNKAQMQMIKECRPSKEEIDEIAAQIQYVKNWNGHKQFVEILDDNIIINENNKDYTFSKNHFLSNKTFQYFVIKDYKKLMGNVFIKFIKKSDDKYLIIVNQMKQY